MKTTQKQKPSVPRLTPARAGLVYLSIEGGAETHVQLAALAEARGETLTQFIARIIDADLKANRPAEEPALEIVLTPVIEKLLRWASLKHARTPSDIVNSLLRSLLNQIYSGVQDDAMHRTDAGFNDDFAEEQNIRMGLVEEDDCFADFAEMDEETEAVASGHND